LDPEARSPVGAEGIAQFMPGTAKDVWERMGYRTVNPRAAGPSIKAGAFYMADLRGKWKAERPEKDRMQLAQASYNAGFGNLLKSQRKCGGNLWTDISPCLRLVTGRHHKETLTYVERIWGYWLRWS